MTKKLNQKKKAKDLSPKLVYKYRCYPATGHGGIDELNIIRQLDIADLYLCELIGIENKRIDQRSKLLRETGLTELQAAQHCLGDLARESLLSQIDVLEQKIKPQLDRIQESYKIERKRVREYTRKVISTGTSDFVRLRRVKRAKASDKKSRYYNYKSAPDVGAIAAYRAGNWIRVECDGTFKSRDVIWHSELVAGPETRRSKIHGPVLKYHQVDMHFNGKEFNHWVSVLIPRWAVKDRRLPAGSRFETVRLHRDRVGLRYEYSIQFQLSEVAPKKVEAHPAEYIGVDLGWHSTEIGCSIAFSGGGENSESELIIPEKVSSRIAEIRDLQSILDNNFNSLISKIREIRGTQDCPDWFSDATLACHAWKDKYHRIVKLAGALRSNPGWQPADDLLTEIDGPQRKSYLRNYRHLFNWVSYSRQKQVNQIKDLQLKYAQGLLCENKIIFIENIVAQPFKDKLDKSDQADQRKVATALNRRRIQDYGPFRFLALLRQIGGDRVKEVECRGTSSYCTNCKKKHTSKDGRKLWCPSCLVWYDRDRNAVIELVKRGIIQGSVLVSAESTS